MTDITITQNERGIVAEYKGDQYIYVTCDWIGPDGGRACVTIHTELNAAYAQWVLSAHTPAQPEPETEDEYKWTGDASGWPNGLYEPRDELFVGLRVELGCVFSVLEDGGVKICSDSKAPCPYRLVTTKLPTLRVDDGGGE